MDRIESVSQRCSRRIRSEESDRQPLAEQYCRGDGDRIRRWFQKKNAQVLFTVLTALNLTRKYSPDLHTCMKPRWEEARFMFCF